jgi:hypothetical protein
MIPAKYIPTDGQGLLKTGLIIGATYFLVVRPILVKVGIQKTAEDRKREDQIKDYSTSTASPFNPNYWKTVSKALILTSASSDALAKTIYDAIGFFYDDENAVYGVFRQLKAKTQVSYLADVFFKKYNYDLYQYLARNLNANELAIVNGIVSNLA